MTDRLKAWCHWKRKEKHVSEDTMRMVRDIEALMEVAEAAKKFLDTTGDGDNGPPVTWVDDWNALEERLERLEAVGE